MFNLDSVYLKDYVFVNVPVEPLALRYVVQYQEVNGKESEKPFAEIYRGKKSSLAVR